MPAVGHNKKVQSKVRSKLVGIKKTLQVKSKRLAPKISSSRKILLAKRNQLAASQNIEDIGTVNDDVKIPDTAETKHPTEEPCSTQSIEVHHINSTTALVCLNHSSAVKIHGKAKITAVKGKFQINGCLFKPGVEHSVFAPLTHVAFVLEVLFSENKTVCTENTDFTDDVISKIQETSKAFDTIAVFTSIQTCPLPGYPDIYVVKPGDVEERKELCKGCWSCTTNHCFVEHDDYAEAVKNVLTYETSTGVQSHLFPVVMATGGKNVGKSTFCRYLVNKLLHRFSHVYYLECDVGQTEFTPSGMLSVTKIKNTTPLLGPPFTHQWKPLYSCFYGNNNPSGDPDRYMDCIEFLLSCLCKNLNDQLDGPLIINTMGWIRALGLQLLVDTIRISHPTHVVQFLSDNKSRNAVALTPEVVSVANGWMTAPTKRTQNQKYTHLQINHKYSIPEVIKYMAPDMRNLALLSYLSNVVTESETAVCTDVSTPLISRLQGSVIRSVSTQDVAICNATDHPIKKKFLYSFINASIVGLCVIGTDDFSSYKESDNDYLPTAPVCPCLGLGLITGVNPNSEEIMVITSLPMDVLQNVNCIICGNIGIPEPLMLEQNAVNGKIPYITRSFPYTTIGAGMFRVHRKFSKLPTGQK
uniref:Polynucleotide 5'-hydroxyl-kinase NOL9 n=1 Tax=Phallusia mammillata TaxID=59560 RepID=A0A6F9DN25_9ASCI|nr:polynucleotide 5'-hydroxyl-kinase NOL9-like [Phallusia mammillata]